jgi:Aldo/keto reductase family
MTATQLATNRLGATGLEITRVGRGAWAIGGGGWEHGWGPQEDDESIAAIREALGRGINWIDTAAVYGFGHSEHVVGRALEGLAQQPYVFTKASQLEGPTAAPTRSTRSCPHCAGGHSPRVAEDVESADLSGLSETPTFFINGPGHYGASDIDALSAAVRAARVRSSVATACRSTPPGSRPSALVPDRTQTLHR